MLELVDNFETNATDVAASIMTQLNNTKNAVSFKKIVQDIDHYNFAEAQEKLIQFIKSNQNLALEKLVEQRTQKLKETQIQIIQRLSCAAEFKDNETGLHVLRLSYYSKFLAERVSTDSEWINRLFMAAPMHDIGKIAIALLEEESGKHFDPQLVPEFMKCLDKVLEIKDQHQDQF